MKNNRVKIQRKKTKINNNAHSFDTADFMSTETHIFITLSLGATIRRVHSFGTEEYVGKPGLRIKPLESVISFC